MSESEVESDGEIENDGEEIDVDIIPGDGVQRSQYNLLKTWVTVDKLRRRIFEWKYLTLLGHG